MKNVTKLFVVVFLITISTSSFAQSLGIKGGLNLTNMILKGDGWSQSNDMKPGFHIGLTAEFPLNEMFSLEPAVLLSTKGYKYSEPGYDESVNALSIDIPLTGKASYDIGSFIIYGAFGPYIGIGLSGKYKTSDSPDYTLQWGSSSDDDLKRVDFGLVFGAGVEINAIQVGISYDLGLINIYPTTDGGTKINNRVLAISAGYWFGKD